MLVVGGVNARRVLLESWAREKNISLRDLDRDLILSVTVRVRELHTTDQTIYLYYSGLVITNVPPH